MIPRTLFASLALLASVAVAQDPKQPTAATKQQPTAFEQASARLQKQLEASLQELSALSARIAAETVPMNAELNRLETKLSEVRRANQARTRDLDKRSLDVDNLRAEIKERDNETSYIANLLSQYVRNLDSRLHVADLERYDAVIAQARRAPEDRNLTQQQVFEAQLALITTSLEHIDDAIGGTTFAGTAVDADGIVNDGKFVLVGPLGLFRSDDGKRIGTAEQQLNSHEPAVVEFASPEHTAAAAALVQNTAGQFPMDPTLGNAHKIAATHETFIEHVKKGGPVMIPIFLLAGLALLIALYKWIALSLTPRPSRTRIAELFDAVKDRDKERARRLAKAMRGPVGRMLAAGVEKLSQPRELIEESMYELVLKTRLKLQSFLPFIAISAASAPLLGLLGTVTGIISTFKLITVFGAGDPGMLSAGISEALITTKFGLIVAIPSLLIHAYLSRKARARVNDMETTAVGFLNEVALAESEKTVVLSPAQRVAPVPAEVDPRLVRREVARILEDMLGPLAGQANDNGKPAPEAPQAGSR